MKTIIKTLEIEERFFIYMLFLSLILSVINIGANIIISFPMLANLKWLVLIITSVTGIFFTLKAQSKRDNIIKGIKILTFSEIIFIFLPNGWIYTGGVTPSTMAYVFLICISICFVCKGFPRILLLASEIFMVLGLLVISEYYPDLIVSNSIKVSFWDNLIQIPVTLIAASVLLILFSNAFRKEHKMLNDYSDILVEKNQKLFQMTIRDELTGLYNRRYIFDELKKLWNNMDESEEIRLALVDVDNFKRVNDTLGHVIGDKILRQIARIMENEMSSIGFAGRYGGDEFVLVFKGVNIESVMSILDRINTCVKEIEIPLETQVSLSGGVSRLTRKHNIDSALSRADDILYQSKKADKNQIISDELMFRL